MLKIKKSPFPLKILIGAIFKLKEGIRHAFFQRFLRIQSDALFPPVDDIRKMSLTSAAGCNMESWFDFKGVGRLFEVFPCETVEAIVRRIEQEETV